jgi:holo-[acyl-carrier protein] synthase
VILGLGIDLIEVERIRASHERFGERFLNRILRPDEIAYCLGFSQPAPHLAARFAAKEAISKAFGTGIGAELGWLDMEVGRHDSGQPYAILHDRGLDLLARRGGGQIFLSLSHTGQHACAVAVIEAGG